MIKIKNSCVFLNGAGGCESGDNRLLFIMGRELIKELENYKKSRIYGYVTGKKEVPVENVR